MKVIKAQYLKTPAQYQISFNTICLAINAYLSIFRAPYLFAFSKRSERNASALNFCLNNCFAIKLTCHLATPQKPPKIYCITPST